MLEKEFNYYLENQAQLVKQYNGKFLVIVGESVEGAFDTAQESYIWAMKKYKPGEFLIQHCSQGEESFTVNMYTPQLTFA